MAGLDYPVVSSIFILENVEYVWCLVVINLYATTSLV